jgi:hypothetical protein
LAFAGKLVDKSIETKWDRGGLGRKRLWLNCFREKRIWVDFERDVVFLDLLNGYSQLSLGGRNRTDFLHEFATEELSKIRRLGIGDRLSRHGMSSRYIKPLGGLKQLYFWDNFGNMYWSNNLLKDKEVVRQRMVGEWEERKEQDKDWEGELPNLRIMRESDSF